MIKWQPEGDLHTLRTMEIFQRAKEEGTISPENRKELDGLIREAALWHRLFGAATPMQPRGRSLEASLPPSWRCWERPKAPFPAFGLDAEIEQALLSLGECGRAALETSGVRCLYFEVRTSIRWQFHRIEGRFHYYSNMDRTRSACEKVEAAIRSISNNIGEMSDSLRYLNEREMPGSQEEVFIWGEAPSKRWQLYEWERFEKFENYLEALSESVSQFRRHETKKRGTVTKIRKLYLAAFGAVLWYFLKGKRPGQNNSGYFDFLSELERVFFHGEDTLQLMPSEAGKSSEDNSDIRDRANRIARVIAAIEKKNKRLVRPRSLGAMFELQDRLEADLQEQIYGS